MAKRHSGKSWWVVLRRKSAVVDERVELARAELAMEVKSLRASCAMVVVVVRSNWDKATAVGRLAVTC